MKLHALGTVNDRTKALSSKINKKASMTCSSKRPETKKMINLTLFTGWAWLCLGRLCNGQAPGNTLILGSWPGQKQTGDLWLLIKGVGTWLQTHKGSSLPGLSKCLQIELLEHQAARLQVEVSGSCGKEHLKVSVADRNFVSPNDMHVDDKEPL